MNRIIEPLSTSERDAFVARARSFIGTMYRHKGRGSNGLDCIGTVVASLSTVGRTVEDREAYSPIPDGSTLREVIIAHAGQPFWKQGDAISLLQPGDVVSLKWHRHPSHVAIVTQAPYGGLALLHSWAEAERVVEHSLSAPWDRRLVEGWRL